MVRVYSTEYGKHCEECSHPSTCCICAIPKNLEQEENVYLKRQTKGRRGKPVVIISGLPHDRSGLKKIAKKLKSKCGVGGAVDRNTILIQGDKRDLLKQQLESMGYKVRISGG